MEQESPRATGMQGMPSRLAKLAATLAKLDTLTQAERRELLAGWELLGARWRTIHAMLRESVTPRRSTPARPQDDPLLTVAEVATQLTVGTSRCYQLIRQRVLPSVTIGVRQVRVKQSALRAYVNDHGKGKETPS